MASFHEILPSVDVSVEIMMSKDVLNRIDRQEADIGLLECFDVPEGFPHRVLGSDTLLVVARPTHPWVVKGRPVSLQELSRQTLIVCGEGTQTMFERALDDSLAMERSKMRPKFVQVGSSAAVLRSILEHGGLAVLSSLAAQDHLSEGRIVAMQMADITIKRNLVAVWKELPSLASASAKLLSILSGDETRQPNGESVGLL
jgi:DNA-binding transcriptional LysR family regulator